MRRIVQIVPEVRPGSGVEGVAFELERELRALGHPVERFTLGESGGGWLRLPAGGGRWRRGAATAARVVWFSTVGTVRARRFLAARPDAVALCHNDVLAGDVYVNHGILRAALRARGRGGWRMLRNPLHAFTLARDWVRYRGGVHRVVVCLTAGEERLLRETYLRGGAERAAVVGAGVRTVVIPNGVDLERFRPASEEERAAARARCGWGRGCGPGEAELGAVGLGAAGLVAVFVGHEFERKGLEVALRAVGLVAGVRLLVVGGSAGMVAAARARAAALGVGERVVFVGRRPDVLPYLHAADVLVLPSAYEANALVVLEALACGLPVVATRVGFAPDLLVDGVNGFLIGRSGELVGRRVGRRVGELAGRRAGRRELGEVAGRRAGELAEELAAELAGRLREVAAGDRAGWRRRARASVAGYSWRAVAARYSELVGGVARERGRA